MLDAPGSMPKQPIKPKWFPSPQRARGTSTFSRPLSHACVKKGGEVICNKKTQPFEVGNGLPTLALSLEGFSSQTKTKPVSWLTASTYSLHLPKVMDSVAYAGFVPLTVAGQRWTLPIVPDYRLKLRYNLVFDPYEIIGRAYREAGSAVKIIN